MFKILILAYLIGQDLVGTQNLSPRMGNDRPCTWWRSKIRL